jgi:hypothetical protein
VIETPETIYLIPGETWDSPEGLCWSDCPAPGEGMDPAEAVKYVRADSLPAFNPHRKALDEITGIPASVDFCEPVEGYADSPMSIVSTVRVMASEITDARDRIEELETMVKVFRGCIETGVYPEPGSPCQRKIFDLVGENN